MTSNPTLIEIGGHYNHYRNGQTYEALMFAIDTDNDTIVIVYQDVDSELIFTRPIKQWFDLMTVEPGDRKVPRFVKVS